MMFTRQKKAKVILSKMVAVFITSCAVVFFILLFSQCLALTVFPLQGNLTSVTTYNELMQPYYNRVFSYFENFYPYLNNIIYMVQMRVVAGVTSLLSFSLTFVRNMKTYILLLLPMMIYLVREVVSYVAAQHFEWARYLDTGLITSNSMGSIWVIIGYLGIELLLSLILVARGHKDDEIWI